MKTIGLIGGISPQSTLDYYSQINRMVNQKLGGHHSAKILMFSLDFEEIVSAIFSNRWDIVSSIMKKAAITLQTAGADVLSLCSNTLHKVSPDILACLDIPFIHILQPVIEIIRKKKIKKIGILGTKFTMEDSFYKSYITQNCLGVEVVVPGPEGISSMDQIIFDFLCKGECFEKNISDAVLILQELIEKGVDAVILGCTELPYLFDKIKSPVSIINTVALHSQMLADFSCFTVTD